MTEATQQVVIIALAPTIAALGAVYTGWRNGKKADAAAALAVTAVGKTKEIHDFVNQNLTDVRNDLNRANIFNYVSLVVSTACMISMGVALLRTKR